LDDLRSISDYIGRDSPRHAGQVIEAVITAAEELIRFPRMGWTVPELGEDNLRERTIYTYRLIYRVRQTPHTRIEIVAVIHGARDIRNTIAPRLR
jgi:plasmid stabilization system protein ParE